MINLHSIPTNDLDQPYLTAIWWLQRIGLHVKVKNGKVFYANPNRNSWENYEVTDSAFVDGLWELDGRPSPDLDKVEFE